MKTTTFNPSFKTYCNLAARVLAVSAMLYLPVTAPAQTAAPAAGTFNYIGDKIELRENGARLDGNARITSPQLEVRAQTIAFDYKNKQVTEVRAIGRVHLKAGLTPQGGGTVTQIETTSDSALLKPPSRELTLTGNVDGFVQQPGRPRTTLAGSKAVLSYVGDMIGINITGPVSVTVPPEPVTEGNTAAIGTVTVTSRDARFDQKSGVLRFVGNARAVSTDGPNQFDLAAPEFVITRGATNTIDTLQTTGRTHLKIDLPPEPAQPGGGVGKPTRVEVDSDSAIVNRQTNTLIFEGNVSGFYYLTPANGEPQKYDFIGTRAVIRHVPENQATAELPAGLRADITNAEVSTPAFTLDLGN